MKIDFKARDKKGKFVSSNKHSVLIYTLIGILIVYGLVSLSLAVWLIVQNHFAKWMYVEQKAVSLQWPVRKVEREQSNILSPWVEDDEGVSMTPEELMERSDNPVVLRGVRLLESSGGNNDGCKDDGLVNGFGFRQNSGENKCYRDFRSVVNKVDEWYNIRLEENGNNIAEALCYYNTGIPNQSTCTYSQNFLIVLSGIL